MCMSCAVYSKEERTYKSLPPNSSLFLPQSPSSLKVKSFPLILADLNSHIHVETNYKKVFITVRLCIQEQITLLG